MLRVLIASCDKERVQELIERLQGMVPNLNEAEIGVAESVDEARILFVNNLVTLRAFFVDTNIQEADHYFGKLTNLVTEIASACWSGLLISFKAVVLDGKTEPSAKQHEDLYAAGCNFHYGIDNMQTFTYVICRYLTIPQFTSPA